MEGADKYFLQVLKGLQPALGENGFRRSSQNFVSESSDCWAVINLQKSRWSEPDEKTFYVNASLTAKRLLAFDGEPVHKAPVHWKCIWNVRAEHLGPEPRAQSWTVRDEQSAADAVCYLSELLCNFVVPFLKPLMCEEAVLKRWANLDSLGYPQLKAKAVLHAASGDVVALRATIQSLQEQYGNGAVAKGVRDHIEKLRQTFPGTMKSI